jgi:nucleoside-diphosphate-sugar epimerase
VKILVTGAAGFIGSHLTRRLAALGFSIRGVDCFLDDSYPSSIKRANYKDLSALNFPNLELVHADLRFDDLDLVLDGIDAVINLAAMPGLMKSWSNFKLYNSCNVDAVYRLLSNENFTAKLFLQASTSSVYGRIVDGDESFNCVPTSPYGVTKLAAENLLEAFHQNFDIQYTCLRYFSVYGPGQRPDMGYSIFINKIINGEVIHIYGDGNASRVNTYIDDCVELTMQAVMHPALNRAVNISGKTEITVNESIRIIEEILGKKATVKYVEKRPGDQIRTFNSSNLAEQLFRVRSEVKPNEGLEKQIQHQLRESTL